MKLFPWFKYLGCVVLAATLTSCASQQAAVMAGKAQTEFMSYAKAANEKVREGEDTRLEYDINNLKTAADLTHTTPSDVVSHTQALIAARDARLAEWAKLNIQAANILTELGAISTYNNTGVKYQDILDLIQPLVTAYTAKTTTTKGATP